MQRFVYRHAWDAAKAVSNLRKHGIRFELAVTVLDDPAAMSRYDDEHSESEERWVTLGRAENDALLVVVHTFEEVSPNEARVRIISARKATPREKRQYQQQ
ncbi:MAG: BrnT family toxin [Rhodanobacteraceae bacterium]